jgi:hypothetical protein
MTIHDVTEARLLRALEVTPSDSGLHRLDVRVAEAMARPLPTPFWSLRTRRLLLRPVLILAAFILLTGVVAGGLGLLDQIFESSGMPGWRTAWDRAERMGIQQTDAGITITLERAYADLNQVLAGFTVAGLDTAPLSGHGEPASLEWIVSLRDPAGRTEEQWTTGHLALLSDETGLSAVVQTWEGAVTPAAGTWVMTFTSVGYNSGGFVSGECFVGNTDPACETPPVNAMVDGTWQFEFELPAPVGAVVSPNVSDTVGEATLTLTQLRITPTMISARISLVVGGNPVRWAFIRSDDDLRHDGATYSFWSAAVNATETEFSTNAGSDEAGGTWEIQIPELEYQTTDEPLITLTGPWTLTVTVP